MPIIPVDVRDLEPPEPLERALAAAQALRPGELVLMTHRREPCLLYPILEKQGFSQKMIQRSPDHFEIYLWRKGDLAAQSLVPTESP